MDSTLVECGKFDVRQLAGQLVGLRNVGVTRDGHDDRISLQDTGRSGLVQYALDKSFDHGYARVRHTESCGC